MSKHIVIIVQNLSVPFDRRVWQEATELHKNGYKISIICPRIPATQNPHEVLDGISIYRHPMPLEAKGALGYLLEYSWSLVWQFIGVMRIFLKQDFDAIHACNPPDTIFLVGGFFKYIFGKKFLFDHHDINPELYEAKFGRRDFFYKMLVLCERLTFFVADISVATNDSYKKIALERGRMSPDKVFVVRSGPSLERMKILPPCDAHKNGKAYLVGYIGVMGQQEGVHFLLQAAQHIVYTLGRNDIHFTLIGSGPALTEMKALAASYNLQNFVTFTGRIPDHELLSILNTADVCVNPDSVNEMNDKSTMNKIMEYMALAKPIIQFDVTEGRFSAQDSSLYAKPNDPVDFAEKILSLINDPARRYEMGQFGRMRVEKELAWPHEAPKLLAAYDALFQKK